jgi:tRNA pseudouridine38-40 synthase
MRNIKLTIEYEGTRYRGWQAQAGGQTIQQILTQAIEAVVRKPIKLYGSGRTDAGVHAIGQVAHFNTDTTIPADKLVHAINAHLPADIGVNSAEDVPEDFHARYSAKQKTYRYTILQQAVRPVLERRFAHWVSYPLDVERMREAAAWLVGKHDFAAFESKSDKQASVRTVARLEIAQVGPRIEIEITADGFLYNMVRGIVGTLIEVGRGKMPPEQVKGLLETRERGLAGPTAPACGLCLVRVEY